MSAVDPDQLKQLTQHLNENALWASCLWGAIASGYWIYGWRQKAMVPGRGGWARMRVGFRASALLRSLISIGIILAVWWLLRQGY